MSTIPRTSTSLISYRKRLAERTGPWGNLASIAKKSDGSFNDYYDRPFIKKSWYPGTKVSKDAECRKLSRLAYQTLSKAIEISSDMASTSSCISMVVHNSEDKLKMRGVYGNMLYTEYATCSQPLTEHCRLF